MGNKIGNNDVKFKNHIKSMSVTITNGLCWETLARNVTSRGKKLLSATNHERRYLMKGPFSRSVTNNFSTTVFYASSVWFDNLKKSI